MYWYNEAMQELDTSFEQIFVSVLEKGAKRNGIDDDAAAIQNTIDYVSDKGGGTVHFPPGTYKANNNLKLKNNVNLSASPGTVTIFMDNDCAGIGEAWIGAENWAWNFNPATAPSFTVHGINFEYRNNLNHASVQGGGDGKLREMIRLFNVQNVTFDSCKFNAPVEVADISTYSGVSCLDLYGNWKNITVKNCDFSLLSNSFIDGGCIWARNFTNDVGGYSEKLLIDNCTFTKKSHDEILALYTCKGNIKNVKVTNCYFKQLESNTVSPVTFTIKATRAEDVFEDVEFTGNTVDIDDVSFVCFNFLGDGLGKINNVKIHHNTWNVNTNCDPATNNPHVVLSNSPNVTDVHFEKNTVTATAGDGCYFKHAVKGIENVCGNTLNGKFQNVITQAAICKDNTGTVDPNITVSDITGITNCKTAENNKIYNVLRGVLLVYAAGTTNQAYYTNNEFVLKNDALARGIFFQSGGKAFVTDAQFINNIFNIPHTSSYAIQMDATATWNVVLRDNRFIGNGKVYRATGASRFKRCDNNTWDTFNDTYATALIASSLIDAFPVGHEVRNSTEGAASKWVRISTTNKNATDYTPITG